MPSSLSVENPLCLHGFEASFEQICEIGKEKPVLPGSNFVPFVPMFVVGAWCCGTRRRRLPFGRSSISSRRTGDNLRCADGSGVVVDTTVVVVVVVVVVVDDDDIFVCRCSPTHRRYLPEYVIES